MEILEVIFIFIFFYAIFHIPAFIMLAVGRKRRKSKPKTAKKLLIIAGIYFIVGGGVCGTIVYELANLHK